MSHNLSIKIKMLVAFAMVAVISCVMGYTCISSMQNIDRKYSECLENYGFAQGDVGKLMAAFCRIDGNVHDAIGYFDNDNRTAAKNNIQKQSDKLDDYIANVEATLQGDETKAIVKDLKEAWKQYRVKVTELADAADTADPVVIAAIQKRLVDEVDPIYIRMYDDMTSLMDNKVDMGDVQSAKLSGYTKHALTAAVFLIILTFLFSMFIGILVAKNIAGPVKACSDRLGLLAKGDLDTSVPEVHTRDEVERLADATASIVSDLKSLIEDMTRMLDDMGNGNFDIHTQCRRAYAGSFEKLYEAMRRIAVRLSDTMVSINQSANQVASGSEQVSSGAQMLSQGATQQASSIEELSATVSEISGQVNESAGNAQKASERAGEVGDRLEESNRQMQEMIAAMRDIDSASSEIMKIIKTIEDLSFQTNILALNAAVEAARAGAAGKGFAVVADEVRNLANKSSNASKDTSVLIETSLKAVANGTKIAHETAESLAAVVEGTRQIVADIDGIAVASGRQAKSIDQVTVGIEQISVVVQTNSATAEESAASSEELSGQAQILKDLVRQFQLKKIGEQEAIERSPQGGACGHLGQPAKTAPPEKLVAAAQGAGEKY